MQASQRLTWIGGALILGGATLLGCYCFMQHAAETAQKNAEEWLKQAARTRQPGGDSPKVLHERPSHGDVVGELRIPRLDLAVMVFEGDDGAILKIGAGHIPATALPQENGNLGIAAHRDSYFRALRFIRANDAIAFTTTRGTFQYTVTDIEIVRPSDVNVLAKAPGRDLTLVTCYPFYYVGSAPKRFIVHAKKIV